MKVLTDFIEIAVNFFQGIMLTYFTYAVLGSKKRASYFGSAGFFYGVVLSVLISVANHIAVFEHFYILFYAVLIFLYALKHLKGKIVLKIFISVFSLMVSSLSSILSTNFFAYIFNVPVRYILSSRGLERYVAMVAAQLIILYVLLLSMKIFRKEFRKNNTMTVSELTVISSVLLISIVICIFLNFLSLSAENHNSRLFTVITSIGIIIINIITCYLTIDLNRKNAIARENEILKLKNEYNRQYIDSVSIQYDAMRKMRHDFKNHFSAVYTCLAEGNTETAMKYIEENAGRCDEKLVFVRTGNDIVNAVVNLKLSAAKSIGIDCTYSSVADFTGIEDSDLCSLLSNLLDNAITAAAGSTRKILQLNISADEWSYLFSVKNSIDSSVLDVNPSLSTTKTENYCHGIGTLIVGDIAKKYEGIYDVYEESGFFCCNVLLNKNL